MATKFIFFFHLCIVIRPPAQESSKAILAEEVIVHDAYKEDNSIGTVTVVLFVTKYSKL